MTDINLQIDAQFPLAPQVLEAGNTAIGVRIRCYVWAAANDTKGRIPLRVALRLGRRADCGRLVNAGLFTETREGYQIPWRKKRPPPRGKKPLPKQPKDAAWLRAQIA